ncbi:MAG: S8 family serine peptidase [Cyanobacteria bacterium P01_F01_bin.150]
MATIPTDPEFRNQWHLQNRTAGLLDLNIVDVWDDYTGDGIEIAIIDDAVERDHPDLDKNYSNYRDWDFEDNDTDASPSQNGLDSRRQPRDSHGTAVAGIIGAVEGNGIGGVGVAYDSTIFGFKGLALDNIAAAINNASGRLQTRNRNREADIVNMSFGTRSFFDRHTLTVKANKAVTDAGTVGRDGLGLIMVKSAGNSRTNNQDTNARLLNTNRHVTTVAAVDQNGFVSSYSNHGASVLVSAFGTPRQVRTTDRTGREGYNRIDSGDFTTSFDGTSAAAPMVSGVAALILEANPDLGWRDVQEILAYSARHVGSNVGANPSRREKYAWTFNGANNWNGGGLHFSNDYGFGLVDAKAAVRLAETWGETAQTSANDVTVSRDLLNSARTISSATGGTSFSQYVSNNIDIEHVEVDLQFTRWHDLGDLKLQLTSPDGTSSILIDNSGEDNESASGGFGSGRWEFYSNAFRGEDTVGTWTVQLFDADSTNRSPITIKDIDITFYGEAASANDTFIFTEEYSDYDGLWGHSRAIYGGAGIDTINAAAVDSNTQINLTTSTGVIDGVAITTSSIETVVTGDGNDTITGSRANNKLSGMRGNDTLRGGAGRDTLHGGRGNDNILSDGDGGFYYGEAGNDVMFSGIGGETMDGGTGTDLIDHTAWNGAYTFDMATGTTNYGGERYTNFENVKMGNGSDSVAGNASANTIYGGGGNDTLRGAYGRDTLYGGSGNDNILSDGDGGFYYGEAGDDVMFSGLGGETMDGGTGTDLIDHTAWNGDYTFNMVTGTTNYGGERYTNFENVKMGGGNDKVVGTTGVNNISTGAGNDSLIGGNGRDILSGGLGADRFIFNIGADGGDIIKDFNRLEGDKLQISKYGFGVSSTSQLSFDSRTGDIFANSTKVATLESRPTFNVATDVVLV